MINLSSTELNQRVGTVNCIVIHFNDSNLLSLFVAYLPSLSTFTFKGLSGMGFVGLRPC